MNTKRLVRQFNPARPKNINGMSRSEFKRILKKFGHELKRNFWIDRKSKFYDRLYRWRFDDGVVDISCPVDYFDRWANSTDCTVTIVEFFQEQDLVMLNVGTQEEEECLIRRLSS